MLKENLGISPIQIIHGDCLKVMKLIPDNSISLVLTDPPYNIANKMVITRKNGEGRNISYDFGEWDYFDSEKDYYDFTKEWVEICCMKLKDAGHFVSFFSKERITWLRDLTMNKGFRYKNVLVVHKTNPVPQLRKVNFCSSTEMAYWGMKEGKSGTFNYKLGHHHNLIETPICAGLERTGLGEGHPTQKPIKVIEWIMKYLTNEGDTVLDPFAGSCTTGVVCKMLNRKFIGIEIDEKYINMAKNRINHTRRNLITKETL